MSENFTIPNNNPAEINSLDGLNEILQENILFNLQKVMPGIVVSYDRNTNRAVIQPAIMGVDSQGGKVGKETLINIPVFSMSGGGIVLSFPVKEGDKGWLIANDRDISIFKQNLEISAPNTYRKHVFNDAFFLPDKINDLNITPEDDGAFVIQSENGTKITLKNDLITLNSENVVINGNTSINGNTVINGSLNVSETITSSGEITGNSIPLSTHIHGNVQSGQNKTGAPE